MKKIYEKVDMTIENRDGRGNIELNVRNIEALMSQEDIAMLKTPATQKTLTIFGAKFILTP